LIADTPDSFASAVLKLAKDATLRDRLARNARALAEERYSWEKLVMEMEMIYKKAVNSER
jgi:glycosyltransferase involved in cell wall biosynthesis